VDTLFQPPFTSENKWHGCLQLKLITWLFRSLQSIIYQTHFACFCPKSVFVEQNFLSLRTSPRISSLLFNSQPILSSTSQPQPPCSTLAIPLQPLRKTKIPHQTQPNKTSCISFKLSASCLASPWPPAPCPRLLLPMLHKTRA
jgi:hypothetical protein